MSLKMSAEPHEPCILITIGDCATEIIGKPVIAAPVVAAAAPVRNLRREAAAPFSCLLIWFSSSKAIDFRGVGPVGNSEAILTPCSHSLQGNFTIRNTRYAARYSVAAALCAVPPL